VRELLKTRGKIFTDPYGEARPMKYRGYLIPEYFMATAYFIESYGVKITNDNFKTFKTWSVELLLRVTKAETLEIIRTSVLGAKAYNGHVVFTSEAFNPGNYAPVKASYLVALSDNRPILISYAITSALQDHEYKKTKSGGHSWTLWGGRDIPEAELQILAKSEKNKAYVRLDYSFYQEVARLYKEAIQLREKPIKSLEKTLGKSTKRVQAYVTKCRKLGLIAPTTQGKSSKVRTPTTRKGKSK